MGDADSKPISVKILWLLAWVRVGALGLHVAAVVWMALTEPSDEGARLFRTGYARAAGFSGPVPSADELSYHFGQIMIPSMLTCALLLALRERSLSGVRWVLGIHAVVALNDPLGLLLIALMFALTFPKSAWSYWHGGEQTSGISA